MSVCARSSGRLIHSVMPSWLYLCFSLGFGRVSIIAFWCKVSLFFFITLCTLRKSFLQTPVYHDHQNGKCMSVSLSSINIPSYTDYTSIPFSACTMFSGSCFFPWVYEQQGWFSPPLHSFSRKIIFYLYFVPAVKNQACFVCLWKGLPWACCAKEFYGIIIPHKELPLTLRGFADIPPLLLLLTGWSSRWWGIIPLMTPIGYQSLGMPYSLHTVVP